MSYEFKGGSPRKMTIGILVVLAILLFVSLFYFAPFAENPPEEPAPPPSTEWTTRPEEPGVEVDLPDTPMTNVPAEAETEQKEAE